MGLNYRIKFKRCYQKYSPNGAFKIRNNLFLGN